MASLPHREHRVTPVDKVAIILRMLLRMACRLVICSQFSSRSHPDSSKLSRTPATTRQYNTSKMIRASAQCLGSTCRLRLLCCFMLRQHPFLGIVPLLRVLLL
jgi:hypothetical protein